MLVLYCLGNGNSFCQCQSLCHVSIFEIRIFFVFIGAMVEMKEEYIFLPWNVTELQRINKYYNDVGLPGCCGLMDVVHVKWSSCPTEDHNRAKGKAGYPTLAFQCITDCNRRVIGIYGPNFGTRNDKEIVKVDPNVHCIQTGWFKDVWWKYYTAEGRVKEDQGVYLICDNGYHRWPTSIFPYTNAANATLKGYFSTNVESVQKDVECTFNILKKQWNVMNNGFYYRDISICENIFVTCCCLNNFLLDQMERRNVRVGCGLTIGNDSIWLDGYTPPPPKDVTSAALSIKFGKR
jgi:hypothetical protein